MNLEDLDNSVNHRCIHIMSEINNCIVFKYLYYYTTNKNKVQKLWKTLKVPL